MNRQIGVLTSKGIKRKAPATLWPWIHLHASAKAKIASATGKNRHRYKSNDPART
jgi:hypothetical protein